MIFPRGDDLQRFYERVPDELMGQRLNDYDYLRRNHFSSFEAIKIITTLTKEDTEGKRYLQDLDLTTEAWQQTIKERSNWYNKRMKHYTKRGLNRRQARRRIGNELLDFYSTRTGDTRKDPTPWDSLRSYYRIGATPRETSGADFIDNLRKREQTYRKRKMPWSVTR